MDINNNGNNDFDRPKMHIPKSNLEKLFNSVSILGVILIWLYL